MIMLTLSQPLDFSRYGARQVGGQVGGKIYLARFGSSRATGQGV